MRSCCVEGCVVPSEDIKFFEFPTSRTLRQRWLDVVKLSGKLTVDSMICSQHFSTTDYELIRGKTRLKRKVVPALQLSKSQIPSKSPNPAKCPEDIKSQLPDNPTKCPEGTAIAQSPTNPKKFPQKSTNHKPPDIPKNTPKEPIRETPTSPVNSIEDSKCPQESGKTQTLQNIPENSTNSQLSPLKHTERSASDDDINATEPTDIEEELNKLQEEKRKSEVLRRKALSKLSEGVNKISERLMRISDNLNKSSDGAAVNSDGLTNGHSDCDKLSIKAVKFGKERLTNLIQNADPKTADIEEMITNYQIKNKIPNNALAVDLEETERGKRELGGGNGESVEIEVVPDIEHDVAPVFIAISVDKDANSQVGPGADGGDCMMVLESVQCEVDPAALLPPDPEPEDDITITSEEDEPLVPVPIRKEDPISLLTSSDEDDVIIEEPHIDTVEVSDETDEDDVPLVKLVKTKKSPKKRRPKKDALTRIMWGMYEFYCVQCHFTCTSKKEYKQHLSDHSRVIQVCTFCSYTTASKAQYKRHIRTHRGDKRFKCHLCEYKARHNMSLIYHLKTHEGAKLESAKRGRGYKCKKCSFRSDVKTVVLRHVKLCSSGKKLQCGQCEYETARKSDLRRHKKRKHKEEDDDDEEYWP